MIAYDLIQTQHEHIRPETSKFSRSSARANIYNATMTNFNTKQSSNPPDKDHYLIGKAGQQNSNKTQKGKPIMAATFYNVSNSKSNQQKEDPFAAFDKPDANGSEDKAEMTSSKGFNITSSDLKKQGITLDKVLGGGFKKIDIYNRSFKVSESPDLFPAGNMGADTDDKNSENDGKNYDSFEILETENEEEQNNESMSGFGKKQGKKKGQQAQETTNVADSNSHNEITEKINKKYKHRVPIIKHKLSNAYRSPEPFTNQEFIEPNEEQVETLKSNRNPERQERPATRGREQQANNTKSYSQNHTDLTRDDTRSISPNDGRGRRDFGNKTDAMQASFYNGNRSAKGNMSEQMNATRQNFKKDESANQFRISKVGFKKTIYDGQLKEGKAEEYNLKPNANNVQDRGYVREENSKIRASDVKQSFINAYGIDPERERRQMEQGAPISESSRMRDTGTRFHAGKTGLQSYSQKNPVENNRIADRIKQHEQEMLSKYSSKRYTNQNDRFNINRVDEAANGRADRRLSTPVREYSNIGSFGGKKLVGKF